MKAQKSYADLSERIIGLLREERERRGITKYAVEQTSGITQQMVSYVERGMRKPSLETALRMADGIGVDLGVIIQKAERSIRKPKA